MAYRDFEYGLEGADLGERLYKGAMLSSLHELAPSLIFLRVQNRIVGLSYVELLVNKTTIVTS